MKKFEHYRFRDGITPLNELELNGRFFDIDARLHAIEQIKNAFDESIQALVNFGIDRINAAIAPVIDEANQELADFQANAQTALSNLVQALQTFQAEANQWIVDLQQLYEIFQDPVLELSELLAWSNRLDPQRDSVIRPDKQRVGSTTITYDGQGRVTEITTTLPYGTYKLQYAYEANGNISTETAKLGVVTLWTRTYQYDSQGNITQWTES